MNAPQNNFKNEIKFQPSIFKLLTFQKWGGKQQ